MKIPSTFLTALCVLGLGTSCADPWLTDLPPIPEAPDRGPCADMLPPSNINATVSAIDNSVTEVRLTWTENEDSRVEGYTLIRTDPNAVRAERDIIAPATEFADRTANNDTQYTYRLQAYGGACESTISEPITRTTIPFGPSLPASGTAAVLIPDDSELGYSIELSWQDESSIEDGYLIERGDGEVFDNLTEALLPVDATSHSDADADRGMEHVYRIYAMAANRRSYSFVEASVLTLPENVQGLAALTEANDIAFEWEPVGGIVNDLSVEFCRFSDLGGVPSWDVDLDAPCSDSTGILDSSSAQTLAANEVSLSQSSLLPGRYFGLSVRANNDAGTSTWQNILAYTAAPPTLAWDDPGSPVYGYDQCTQQLDLNGTAVCNGGSTCTDETAALIGRTGSANTHGDFTGVAAALNHGEPGNFRVRWRVTDSNGNQSTLLEDLVLSYSADTHITQPIEPSAEDVKVVAGEGLQTFFDSETTTTCKHCRGTRASLSAGPGHTCMVGFAENEVWCWGLNTNGQLGFSDGREDPEWRGITAVCSAEALNGEVREEGCLEKPLVDAVQVSVGESFSCALKSTGIAACWGNMSTAKVMGVGVDRDAGTWMSPLRNPDREIVNDLVQIVSGRQHVCGLSSSGEVLCWGNPALGRRGNPKHLGIKDEEVPGDLEESFYVGNAVCAKKGYDESTECTPGGDYSLVNVLSLAAGGAHTCAIENVDGVVCWGNNTFGQLGGSTTEGAPGFAAVTVEATRQPLKDVAALALGENHSCALGLGGKVTCWGDNSAGQLGNKKAPSSSAAAFPVCVAENDQSDCSDVGALSEVIAIAAGGKSTCALMADQRVFCWGDMARITTNNLDNFMPTPVCESPSGECVAESQLQEVVSLTLGSGHLCVVTQSGETRCMGEKELIEASQDWNVIGGAGSNEPGGEIWSVCQSYSGCDDDPSNHFMGSGQRSCGTNDLSVAP